MRRLGLACLAAITLLAMSATTTWAQLEALGVGDKSVAEQNPVKVTAEFTAPTGDHPARLFVIAKIAKGWHTYSLTQPKGGPLASKLTITESKAYKVKLPFKPYPEPDKHAEPAFGNMTVESHQDRVVWTADLTLTDGTDPRKLRIAGKLTFQPCTESNCLFPKTAAFEAKLGKGVDLPTASKPKSNTTGQQGSGGGYVPARSHLTLAGTVTPAAVMPGGTVTLTITAIPQEGYHVYALEAFDPFIVSKPTLIVLNPSAPFVPSSLEPSELPTEREVKVGIPHTERYYKQPVSWTVELNVPRDAKRGEYPLSGGIGFQTCFENGCDAPDAATFQSQIRIGDRTAQGVALEFAPAKYSEISKLAPPPPQVARTAASPTPKSAAPLDLTALKPQGAIDQASQPLLLMLGTAFLGGLILNLMPCVLPVIGLKILSFVEQSGDDRRRVFTLNVAYAAGVIGVFIALATVAVVMKLYLGKQFGWGQQFGQPAFVIPLIGLVFAMALSFLGVWELPIPGFATSGTASKMAAREGVSGAIFKGGITTVLATPCSGPYFFTALGFALSQSPWITYLMFALMGLGMASPYLLIGAFPKLVWFLPKPGAWMDTFKQLMGFVLLGTLVFLFTSLQVPYIVPTVALLIGLWFGCWLIGRVPGYAETSRKAVAWTSAIAATAIVAVVAFAWLQPIMQDRWQRDVERQIAQAQTDRHITAKPMGRGGAEGLTWEMFSTPTLQKLSSEGRTVLVEFTADWCATCQLLKSTVLNSEKTKAAINSRQIATLEADMTQATDEQIAALKALGVADNGLPVLAIFPADRPNEPLVQTGGYTQGKLLEMLEKAGPSKLVGHAAASDLGSRY